MQNEQYLPVNDEKIAESIFAIFYCVVGCSILKQYGWVYEKFHENSYQFSKKKKLNLVPHQSTAILSEFAPSVIWLNLKFVFFRYY